MYTNLTHQIGKQFRRITFSAQKGHDYYVLFSVLELLEKDMQDVCDFQPASDGEPYIRRAHDTSELCAYNAYLTIDNITLTENFLRKPQDNFIINGEKFKFFNPAFAIHPSTDYSYLLKDSFHDDSPTIQKVMPLRQCSKWLTAFLDEDHYATDIIKKNENLQKQLAQLSLDEYGLDITGYPEHMGNIYIVRYNPYIRKVHYTISPVPDYGLFCHFFFREKVNDNLYIRITNKTKGGFLLSEQDFPIPTDKSEHFFPMTSAPDILDVKVFTDREGLILFENDMHFISRIDFNMQVKTSDVELMIKNKDGETKQTLEKFSLEGHSIGQTKQKEVALGEGTSENAYKILENNLEFILFDGDKNKKEENKQRARDSIRKILEKARTRCIICDPYFGQQDIVDFIFPMNSLSVNVRILASKEFMGKSSEESKRIAGEIQRMINSFNQMIGTKIQMRLLTGKSSLHDRFIIADDQVWLLGSSFNELGVRATTITKVPTVSCRGFYALAEKWWSDDKETISLTEYEHN